MTQRLLLIVLVGLLFTTCRKSDARLHAVALDETTATMEVKINTGGFYLNYYEGFEYELLDLYLEEMKAEMGRGQFELAENDPNPEYTLLFQNILFQERIKVRTKRGDRYELGVLGISINYRLIDHELGNDCVFTIWLETHDSISRNGDDEWEVNETSVDAVIDQHTRATRKKMKRVIRAWWREAKRG